MEPNTVASQQVGKPQLMKLPVLVFGRAELRRLGREIEALESYFERAKIREAGQPVQMPKVSRMLEGYAGENGCNLLVEQDRERLQTFLKQLDEKAPVMHLSFATDPSSAFVAKLVAWMRVHIHPYILLQLGLQPGVTAGCVARVNSKMFDLSLREFFRKQRPLLIQELTAGLGASAPILSPNHVAPAVTQAVEVAVGTQAEVQA